MKRLLNLIIGAMLAIVVVGCESNPEDKTTNFSINWFDVQATEYHYEDGKLFQVVFTCKDTREDGTSISAVIKFHDNKPLLRGPISISGVEQAKMIVEVMEAYETGKLILPAKK